MTGIKNGLREFNSLLLSSETGKGKFILGAGKFGYADLNIAPFVARILSASKHGFITGKDGEKSVHEELEKGEGLERVKDWWNAVEAEEVWKKVWDEEKYLGPLKKGVAKRRAEEAAKGAKV